MIQFTYHGEAVGKGRPRVTRRGGFVQTYTPPKTRAFEEAIKFEFMAGNSDPMPVYPKGEPLVAYITVYEAIPKSYTKKQRKLIDEGKLYPTKKPDCDNILKAVLDALNGCAYEDDSQVVHATISKAYADEPSVIVNIMGWGEDSSEF